MIFMLYFNYRNYILDEKVRRVFIILEIVGSEWVGMRLLFR